MLTESLEKCQEQWPATVSSLNFRPVVQMTPTELNGAAADARKRLRWLVKQGPISSVRVAVTPDFARFILDEFNTGNRPISANKVSRYAKDMVEGRWLFTGEPIIFADNGVLNDGQHRLAACVASGVTLAADFKFGVPRAAFAVTDIGMRRTAGDIFAINGVKDSTSVAAIVLWLWKHANECLTGVNHMRAPSPQELFEFYQGLPRLHDSVRPGERFSGSKLATPSVMSAMHYLCAQKHRVMADEFFDAVASGIGFSSARDPRARLREKLIQEATGGRRLHPLYAAVYTIQAWNAVREKKPVGVFRWRDEQRPNVPFPKVL